MASKKTMPKKSRKNVKKTRVETTVSDRELRRLQRELKKSVGKSVLIEEDLRELKHKLRLEEPPKTKPKKEPQVFYKKFVFKCGKCVGEFRHTAKIPVIEYTVVCPTCRKEHVIEIKPLDEECEIKLPESIKLVK